MKVTEMSSLQGLIIFGSPFESVRVAQDYLEDIFCCRWGTDLEHGEREGRTCYPRHTSMDVPLKYWF